MMNNARILLVAISLCSTAVYAQSYQSQLDALTQLEEIRAEVQALRGELEVTQHQITQLEQQQRDFYDDLNQRVNELAKTKTVAPAATISSAPVSSAPAASGTVSVSSEPLAAPTVQTTAPGAYAGSEGQPASSAPQTAPGAVAADTQQAIEAVNEAGNDLGAYQAAYNFLQNKQYGEAVAGFNAYLKNYPQGEYVANSDYWLGEIYLIQNNYPQAEQAFSQVVNQFPTHQKSADALLKLGYVYEASGDHQKALTTFEQVQQKYPNTAVAQLAGAKATQLRQKI